MATLSLIKPLFIQPKHLLFIFALSLSGFTSITSYADHHTASDQHSASSDKADHGHKDDTQKRCPMTEELNLDDKQKASFKNAMKQMRESMGNAREMHDQLREVVQSDNYDEKKIHSIIQKSNKEREDSIVKGTNAMHEFYASLSAEQKTKYQDMHKQMKERMKDRMKGGMKDHMGKQCDEGDDDI